jgi:hypothetical protein
MQTSSSDAQPPASLDPQADNRVENPAVGSICMAAGVHDPVSTEAETRQ